MWSLGYCQWRPFFLLPLIFGVATTTKNLKVLETEGVVPDVIDSLPARVVNGQYNGGININFGNAITPTVADQAPHYLSWGADPAKMYLLAMTDPDAPSRSHPLLREFQHWLVGNIQGDDVASGTVLAEYRPPGPPKGTGKHRYVFVVYEQHGPIDYGMTPTPRGSSAGRPKFSIRKFAKKHGLGVPIAANFFYSEFSN